MHDPSMADQKLIEENALLQQRILDLERSDAERKRSEAALRESQELFQGVLDNAPLLVYVKDLEGRLTFVNRRSSSNTVQ